MDVGSRPSVMRTDEGGATAPPGSLRAQMWLLRPALWAVVLGGMYLLYRRVSRRRRGAGGSKGSVPRPKKEAFAPETLMALDIRRSKAVQELQAQYELQAKEHQEKQERERLRKLEEVALHKAEAKAEAAASLAAAAETGTQDKVAVPPAAPAVPPAPRGSRRGGCA